MATGTKLFVGCLPYSKLEADIQPIFEQFGPVQEVHVLRKDDGSSKGAAFVTYQSMESATAALTYLQNYTFPGSTRGINISVSGGSKGGKGGGKGGWSPGPRGPPPMAYPSMAYPSMVYMAPAAPGSKVFVGQLPYSKSEADLWQLFGSIGPVAEVVLMKDSKTQEKKGAAFVRFQNAHSAGAAVAALNGFMFSGSPRPITVSIAHSDDFGQGQKRSWASAMPSAAATIHSMGQQAPGALSVAGLGHGQKGGHGQPGFGQGHDLSMTVEGAKLFVGQLPFSKGEEEIKQVFSKYGQVAEVFLHRDLQGQKKGGAFVRFFSPDHAFQALEMDGFLFQGATRPITVALAGQDGAKKQRTG